MARHSLTCIVASLAVVLAACDAPPIQWRDPVALTGQDTQIQFDSTGRVVESMTADGPDSPEETAMCAGSFRWATGAGNGYHGAWWRLRSDGTAVLYSAVSLDGHSWSTPAPVDTQDVTTHGCDRPPPSLAVVGDDLQIAYSMRAPEGTGVFMAHYMGSMLHEPVAVIFGQRLVGTAIAAEGDRIAVAYEDPNGARPRVDVAVSSSQGHLFEIRTTASRDVDIASTPAVALAGRMIAVAWSSRRAADSAATRVARVGQLP